MILFRAGWHRQEHSTLGRKDAPQLRQRSGDARIVTLCTDTVDAVVATDVLDRGDAADEVKRCVGERERANVAGHRTDALDSRVDGIEPDDFTRCGRHERVEVRRRGVRVADVEHARLAPVSREHPGDLDQPFVRSGRCLQLARPNVLCPCAGGKLDCVVERAQQRELVARDQLRDQLGPRQRRCPGTRTRIGIGWRCFLKST